MKYKTQITLLIAMILLGFGAGCASIQVPPAKHYEVKITDTTVRAKTVQVRGNWVLLDGVDWIKGLGPRQTPTRMLVPTHAISYIDAE